MLTRKLTHLYKAYIFIGQLGLERAKDKHKIKNELH